MKLDMRGRLVRHKPAANEPRIITVNKSHLHEHYKGNYTSTTKYNPATYLPKALFEQFRYKDNTLLIWFQCCQARSNTNLA